MGHHPGRANFRSDPVKDLRAITRDDQNVVIRCHLNDVKAAKSFNVSGLRYDLVFSTSKQIGTRRFAEVKMIDNGCRHTRHPRCCPVSRPRRPAITDRDL
jgi:hypothetical protein